MRESGFRIPDTAPVLFALAFGLILLLNLTTLADRPYWDAAMSVFRAAAELERLDFDLPALLAMPRYDEGGPNVHALTIPVVVMVGMMRVLGEGDAFFIAVRLLHFALYAGGLVCLYRVLQTVVSQRLALAGVAMFLFYPLTRVQLGAMYLDLPAASAGLIAFHFALRQRVFPVALWLLVAILFKQTAIVIAGFVALTLWAGSGWQLRGFLHGAAVALLPLSFAVFRALSSSAGAGGPELSFDAVFTDTVARYLLNVPDLMMLSLFGGLWSLAIVVRWVWQRPALDARMLLELACAAGVLLFALLHFLIAPIGFGVLQALPRYYLLVLPLLLMLPLLALHRHRGESAALILAAVWVGGSLLNTYGLLYPNFAPKWGQDISIAERSFEYRDLVAVQRAGLAEVERLARRHTTLVSSQDVMLMSEPYLGYASEPPPMALRPDEYARQHMEVGHFPDCLYGFLIYPWQETANILTLLQLAGAEPGAKRGSRTITVGDYEARLMGVAQAGAECLEL